VAERYDFVVVGAGIIGLTSARALKRRHPKASICILEKEAAPALHASGRNSGVIHAGFYYSADSLKARFTRDGNRLMKEFCREQSIPMNECGKLVVAADAAELEGLRELKRRGDVNGVDLQWVSADEAAKYEPNARTHEAALYSPTTASVDPVQVNTKLAEELQSAGIEIRTGAAFESYKFPQVATSSGEIEADYLVNCAGLYADTVAHGLGVGLEYVLIPFKGVYLKWCLPDLPVKMHIYPVPNLNNPFLGVHYTMTADNHVKIGPTAMPAFWRENYGGWSQFKMAELTQVLGHEAELFLRNSFGFRKLAVEELKKRNKRHLVNSAARLVKQVDPSGFCEWGRPGIRAQLMHKKTLKLVQDFVVEPGERSMHVLNAVSPGFTCAFPIGERVAEMVDESR
jgi:L-2-hydroxyglutarate oxidase